MKNDLQETLNATLPTNTKLLFSQTGDKNTQIAHADHVTINNYPIAISSKVYSKYFSDIIDENLDGFFIKTHIYAQVKKALKEANIVVLIGQPGIGKTITAKMISNDYKAKGYKILYSEEGNIGNTNDLLNEDTPQNKTFIVLNDFLGQFYTTALKMQSANEINEVRGLIALVKRHRNIKLLITTRGVIYQEAMNREKFSSAIENNSDFICEIKIDDLTFEEKALILHSHLKRAYKNGILSNEHYSAIMKDREYLNIALDKNFSPIVIEHMTRKKFLTKIQPHDYVVQVFSALKNPSKIWKDEYEGLDDDDRICLDTLFSLTNTNVTIEMLKKCFNKRINNAKKDMTINYFERTINRLLESLISIVDFNGEQRIGIIHPSLNDFLFSYLTENTNQMSEILKYSLYYEQIERLISCKMEKGVLVEQIQSGLFRRLSTFPKQVFSNFEMCFTPPRYLYLLKILLIYLDDSDLIKCGIQKKDIQDTVLNIFESQYDDIEANSRFYFAYEFPDIFNNLFKSDSGYDLTGIVTNEKYFNVVLNSLVKHDDFMAVIVDIQNKYFASMKEKFYSSTTFKSCFVEKITSEVIAETHGEISALITDDIEYNWDEVEDYEDYDDIADYILSGIEWDISELITDSIFHKLDECGIDSVVIDDFDIDTIISDELDISERIEREYDKIRYTQTDDFKETVQEPLENIIALFEDIKNQTPEIK